MLGRCYGGWYLSLGLQSYFLLVIINLIYRTCLKAYLIDRIING